MVKVCWFSSFWCHFDLVKRFKFSASGHFPENAWREWPEILYADVSRPPSELIRLWSWSVNFYILALFWHSEMGQIWDLWSVPGEPIEEMARHFACWCILTTFQNWLDNDHSLLIFLILTLFWLSETGQIWVSRHFGGALWIFFIMVPLWLRLVIFGLSWHYLEKVWK